MLLETERRLVVGYARRLRADGLVVGTAGNVSAREGPLVAITPTSIDYDELEPSGVAVVNLAGLRVDEGLPPSSELPMHLAAYRATDAHAVVHTHSPFASALAIAGVDLPPVHYLAARLGGEVRLAPYATFGTPELAESVSQALEGRTAALLEAHGAITVGDSVAEAYDRALYLEWLAAAFVRASALAAPVALDCDELERTRERLKALATPRARRPVARTPRAGATTSPVGGKR